MIFVECGVIVEFLVVGLVGVCYWVDGGDVGLDEWIEEDDCECGCENLVGDVEDDMFCF